MIRDLLKELGEFSWMSDDPTTQNAAVIVAPNRARSPAVSNIIPYGLYLGDGRCHYPLKSDYIEHAERAAIAEAARMGFATEGCTMVALWAACPACARAIIQAGIVSVHVAHAALEATPDRWVSRVRLGIAMLHEAGVRVTTHRNLRCEIRFDDSILTL